MPPTSIDYIAGLTRTILGMMWMAECLTAANVELGLRWLHDRAHEPHYTRFVMSDDGLLSGYESWEDSI
jgi:hypothetical protein